MKQQKTSPERKDAGIDAGMDTSATTATEPTANATMHDDLQALIAELREANALIAIDIRRAASEAAEATTDGVDTIERNEPAISKAQRKALKPVTVKQQRFIDGLLDKLFNLNDFDHLRVLVKLTETGISKKGNRLLDDARRRGNWQASALWLEMHHPDRWAPRPQNIVSMDSGQSGKSFRKARKAGRYNGTSK